MTFSVLALDGESGQFGVATATCTLAVGAAVQAVAPVGGVVTQGWTNRRFRAAGLGLLRSGLSAGEVLAELLHDDEAPARRQVAVLDLEGRVADGRLVAVGVGQADGVDAEHAQRRDRDRAAGVGQVVGRLL